MTQEPKLTTLVFPADCKVPFSVSYRKSVWTSCRTLWICSKNTGRIVNIKKMVNNFKFLEQISVEFCKKIDNYVTNPTSKFFFIKIKATQEN